MGISRAPKLEWNLNTVLQIISLLSFLVVGVSVWANTTRDIEEIQRWRTGHDQYHKERLVDVKAIEARGEERLRSLEADTRKTTSQIENLSYRVTVTEQSTTSTAGAIRELQNLVSQQAGDIKVAREILQRIEAAQRQGVERQ